MKKLLVLASTILVAVGAALTYFYFEAAVRHSIDYIWGTLLNTDARRALVIPTCIVISLVFFGLQHYLGKKSENSESHGLGQAPAPTIVNFIKIIGIGFFSLVAGASLGPEAILVPACIMVGGFVGRKLFKKDEDTSNLLGVMGFIALFAAFFDSFWAGMLALLLVSKVVKIKLDAGLIVLAAISSLVTVVVLNILSSKAYATLPPNKWKVSLAGLAVIVGLFLGGYAIAYLLKVFLKAFAAVHEFISKSKWWQQGLAAASGLSILYLLGGSLVEFTGNSSIVPMLKQSTTLGIIGLAWILVIKVLVIGWSKAMGYRGGLIFPSIFVASVLVAIVQLYTKDVGFVVGLIVVMAGIVAANTKLKILF